MWLNNKRQTLTLCVVCLQRCSIQHRHLPTCNISDSRTREQKTTTMRRPELNITSAMKRIRNKQHNETVIIQLEYTTRSSMLMDLMDYSYTKQNSRLRAWAAWGIIPVFTGIPENSPDNLETPKASLSNSDTLNRKKTEQRSTQWPIIHKNKPDQKENRKLNPGDVAVRWTADH